MYQRLIFSIALSLAARTGFASPNPEYAENYTLETFQTHQLLTIRNPWKHSGETAFRYALIPRDGPLPKLAAGIVPIRVPVKRLAIMATTYLGPVSQLDLYDRLIGVADYDFINDPIARQRVDSGQAKLLPSGAAIDIEAFIRLQPDLILTSSTGNPTFDVSPQLARAGLPVVITASYMESHPLARSEWVKVIGAFFDKEEEASSIFNDIAGRYNALAAMTAKVESRPTVFANAPYGGIWHLPGGQSYSAKAFADAGADYLWADNPDRGGVPIDLEVILSKAANADIWINPSHYRSLRELLSADERFANFAALRTHRVFNNTLRTNEHGGNEIWERGVANPDQVLADLIAIFHPELLPDHTFVFYEQLR